MTSKTGKLTKAQIGSILQAAQHEPRSLLGYHEFPRAEGAAAGGGACVRAGRGFRRGFLGRQRGRHRARAQACARGGHFRRQHRVSPAAGAVSTARALSRRARGRQTRHLFLLARVVGLRPAPVRRRAALRHLSQVWRASAGARGRRRRALRRVGAECQTRQRGRRFQPVGRPQTRHAGARQLGRVGTVRARHRRGCGLQVRDPRAATATFS